MQGFPLEPTVQQEIHHTTKPHSTNNYAHSSTKSVHNVSTPAKVHEEQYRFYNMERSQFTKETSDRTREESTKRSYRNPQFSDIMESATSGSGASFTPPTSSRASYTPPAYYRTTVTPPLSGTPPVSSRALYTPPASSRATMTPPASSRASCATPRTGSSCSSLEEAGHSSANRGTGHYINTRF